jgi:maltooligosyltrehalose trehalohydrolase
VSVPVDASEVLVETPSGVDLDDGTITVPAHAGALLR